MGATNRHPFFNMKLWNKIKNSAKNIFSKSYHGLMQSRLIRDDLNWNKSDFLKANKISLYVNKAIKKRGEKVAQTEFFMKRGDEIIDDPSNEWLRLIDQPNNFLSGPEFWELYQRYKDITGCVFIYKEPGISDVPAGLHLMKPDRVKINMEGGEIVSYDFRKENGATQTFPAEEVIYSFHPDPENPMKGESIIKSGEKIVDTQIQIDEYQHSILKNGGKVEGVFNFKVPRLNKEQVEELKAGYQDQYGEAKKAGMPLFLGSEASYSRLGLTPEELDYLETKKTTLNDIVIMTGVPKSILASVDDVKFSNAKQSEITFMKHTIKPLVKNLVRKLNQELIPDELELDFEDPVPENEEEKRKNIETADQVNALTINEKREALGYEPIEGGDKIFGPVNLFPFLEEDRDDVVDTRGKKEKSSKKDFHPLRDKSFRERYGKKRDKQLSREENRVADKVKDFFKSQRDRILERLEQGQGTPDVIEIFDRDAEQKLAEKMMKPLLERVLINSGQDTVEFARSFQKQEPEDFFIDTSIRTWLEERSQLFAKQITQTTFEKLKKVFNEAFDSNNPRQELVKGIESTYENYTTSRAETIARTETHGAFQKGTFEGYKQGDIPIKIWVTVGDSEVRPSHQLVDGEEQPIDATFSNGLMYPGDSNAPAGEIVNCRCQM